MNNKIENSQFDSFSGSEVTIKETFNNGTNYLIHLDKIILYYYEKSSRIYLLDDKILLDVDYEDISPKNFGTHVITHTKTKEKIFELDSLLFTLINKNFIEDNKINNFMYNFYKKIANQGILSVYDKNGIEIENHTAEYSFKKLSDFDYKNTDNKIILLDCKIKRISKPKLKNGIYEQKVIFCDNNTNFELEAILSNELIDFNKWEKNDNVRLIGLYSTNNSILSLKGKKNIPCFVTFMEKRNPTFTDESCDIDIKLSRSQEIEGYDEWRKTILAKDDHKCVCCGLDKHLHVHHLFGYSENPNLAVDENNGVTLCKFCHERYHSIYGVKNINPRDFIEYISKYGD